MRLDGRRIAERGFSLVEMLVALLLLALILTFSTAIYVEHERAREIAARQMAVQQLLLDTMERLRALAPLPDGVQTIELSEDGQASRPQLPTEGRQLVVSAEPWEGAEPGENIQLVVVRYSWDTGEGRRGARLEALLRGPLP